jgi:hypothetical protein
MGTGEPALQARSFPVVSQIDEVVRGACWSGLVILQACTSDRQLGAGRGGMHVAEALPKPGRGLSSTQNTGLDASASI